MLSRTERCSSEVSCVTMPIWARSESCVTAAMSCPSIRMRAALEVVEAQQQVDQRRLAGARAADEADLLARLHRQRQVLDDALALAVVEADRARSRSRRAGTEISLAPGRSSTRRGSEIEAMPSWTVPIFSNSAETSHMIHCDMPHSRSTRPMTTATAPIVTSFAEPQPDRQRGRPRTAAAS